MKDPSSYVLVVDQGSDDLQRLESLLRRLSCAAIVTQSVDQAVERASQALPYLIILSGSQLNWSKTLVDLFRTITSEHGTTIVALTERHSPSWLRQEENPGLDGLLVKPLDRDVLLSLVQSAWARQGSRLVM